MSFHQPGDEPIKVLMGSTASLLAHLTMALTPSYGAPTTLSTLSTIPAHSALSSMSGGVVTGSGSRTPGGAVELDPTHLKATVDQLSLDAVTRCLLFVLDVSGRRPWNGKDMKCKSLSL